MQSMNLIRDETFKRILKHWKLHSLPLSSFSAHQTAKRRLGPGKATEKPDITELYRDNPKPKDESTTLTGTGSSPGITCEVCQLCCSKILGTVLSFQWYTNAGQRGHSLSISLAPTHCCASSIRNAKKGGTPQENKMYRHTELCWQGTVGQYLVSDTSGVSRAPESC